MNFRTKLTLAACSLTASAVCGWAAGCSSTDNTTPAGQDSGAVTTEEAGSGSDAAHEAAAVVVDSGSGPSDTGISDASEGGGLGLLVDDMSAKAGTQISLHVPAGETPGSYYTFPDPFQNSQGTGTVLTSTPSLADGVVMPPIVNPDGSEISGQLCVHGFVVNYALLGLNLAYGHGPDASPESGISTPVTFDAHTYHGVSFYILEDATDGPSPTIHFGIPDTNTADPSALATSSCAVTDAAGCDDDFGADIASSVTPGVWTKISYQFSDLKQQGFGDPVVPAALRSDALIGMKWQANGGGFDASVEPFGFCISDIYFTP